MNDNDKMNLLDQMCNNVKECLIDTARVACKLGYSLMQIRDNELFKFSDNYKNYVPSEYTTPGNVLKFTKYTFYDYCKDVFNFSRRSVDRFMKICLLFSEKSELSSVTGCLDGKFKDYSVSALAEMLSLSEKQREQCSPDMTVREIRSLKQETESGAAMPSPGTESEPEAAPQLSGNWNDVVSSSEVDYDNIPLMRQRTFKKKKYNLDSEEYDCFVDSVSSYTSAFKKVADYLSKGYLLRLVLYKPEDKKVS